MAGGDPGNIRGRLCPSTPGWVPSPVSLAGITSCGSPTGVREGLGGPVALAGWDTEGLELPAGFTSFKAAASRGNDPGRPRASVSLSPSWPGMFQVTFLPPASLSPVSGCLFFSRAASWGKINGVREGGGRAAVAIPLTAGCSRMSHRPCREGGDDDDGDCRGHEHPPSAEPPRQSPLGEARRYRGWGRPSVRPWQPN